MANEKQKIITKSEVVTHAIARGSDFDEDLLDDYILPAQRKYVRNFLGKDYYEDLLDMVAGTTAMTADTSVLLNDYLKPSLAHYVVYTGFDSITLDLSSKGVLRNTSETAESASTADRANAKDHYLKMALIWENDAEEYVRDQQENDATKFSDFKGKNSKSNLVNKYIPY